MIELTQGGLFEGIGGFPLAATWAGIKPIWSNEIDPWCCKVLRKNFEHEIIEKDIRLLTSNTESERGGAVFPESKIRDKSIYNEQSEKSNIKKVDILTGGFPCQPFSHAGKRKGENDDRYLWPEYLRLIRELQPPWIVAENVAGLISMENGKTLEGILNDLENENYQTEIYNIPACGVGAWHRRDRIWIVAHNNSIRRDNGKCSSKKGSKRRDKSFNRNEGLDKNVSDTGRPGLQKSTRKQIKGIREKEGTLQGSKPGRANAEGWEYWATEPNVGRVANGIPGRVDRLKGLGNAIVPQVAYEIFKAIVDYEQNKLYH